MMSIFRQEIKHHDDTYWLSLFDDGNWTIVGGITTPLRGRVLSLSDITCDWKDGDWSWIPEEVKKQIEEIVARIEKIKLFI
jgi:hypothetical protein